MAFDPDSVDKFKSNPQPAPAGGFDPSLVDKYKGTGSPVAAPLQASVDGGRIASAFDFVRRAFMGDTTDATKRNKFQNAVNDAEDLITGTSHLIGQTAVGGAELARDVGKSAAPLMKQILGITPAAKAIPEFAQSPVAKRAQAFPGQVEAVMSPEGREMMGGFVKSAAKDMGASFGVKKDPVDGYSIKLKTAMDKFHDHPFFTFIDWTTAASLVGGAARGGLEVAGKALGAAGKTEGAAKVAEILSTARESLPTAPRGEIPREFSTNPMIKYGIQKPFDKAMANPALQEFIASSPVLKYLAPMEAITPEARAGRMAGKVIQSSQDEFYRMRDARMQEVMDKFGSLSPEEQKTFIPIIQGRAMPGQMSPKFKEVYEWYKNTVADEQAKFGFTDETVKRVAYQPLAVSSGLLTSEDYKLALRGEESAMAKVRKVTNDLADARERMVEDSIKEWMGKNTQMNKRTKEFRSIAKEVAEQTAPDPTYFPSVFQDKIKLADFLPNRFMQKFKPGFMKGRTGAFGFIEDDPASAFAIHQSQVERFLQNEHLINSIKEKFAMPLKKASDLKDGYKVFAPDGYLGFYKGSMPLQEAFLRGVGMNKNIDEAFLAAIQKVMPEMVENKNFIGVRRPTLYQIPSEVAKKLTDIMSPGSKMPEPIKLFYDKPLQAFKFSVLGMSPRWIVNNTVGNIVTTMSGRVSPESYIKAINPEFSKLIPPEVTSGGFRRAEIPALKKVLSPQSGIADRVTGFFSGRLPTEGVLKDVQNVVSAPVKAIGKFADTVFEANSQIEDLFRKATFIDKTTKAAVEQIAKDTATGIIDMKSSLNKFLQRGEFSTANVAKVAGEMLKEPAFKEKMVGEVNRILNDYSSMSKFERDYVRRVVPFWSWYKFVTVLFWSMPVKDPMMAQTIKQLGVAGQDIAAKEWKANGLNVKEVPEWMRGNVILGMIPKDKMLAMLNTRSLNPLSAATEFPSLAPMIQMAYEQKTGRSYLTGQPFTHPNEVEVNGVMVRKTGNEYERIDHATPPPIGAHYLRQFPQTGILESLLYPYRTYSGEGLFSNTPVTRHGKPVPLDPKSKIASILGMPISEADYRALRNAHMNVRRGANMIERNTTRSDRANERIRLGLE